MTHTGATLVGRYQTYRTRRFLANERRWANMLTGWRTRTRRRRLVGALVGTFVFMFSVGVICAFDVDWAPLLWLPAMLLFIPLWSCVQIVSGRQGDAPTEALDEWEIEQRNAARSIGLTVTQALTFVPAAYLILVGTFQAGTGWRGAYAGGLMTLSTLIAGACTPAIILAWTRPDLEPDD